MKTSFILGDSKAVCDQCGFDFHQSMLKKRWDGAMVCAQDFEVRHPQDMTQAKPERNNVRDARPAPEPRYLAVGEITAADL